MIKFDHQFDMPTQKPITPEQRMLWSRSAHALFLEALMSQSEWTAKELVFHGGTSLHLSWNSTRYSEDLDFLLSRSVTNAEQVSKKVERQLQEAMRVIDPDLRVELRDKSKDAARMLSYMLTISHPLVIGNVKVKAEFWRTEPKYLEHIPTELRTPDNLLDPAMQPMVRISNPVPAVTLEAAYADKLTAFATRPRVKWRDIYDLWWIGTQSRAKLDIEQVCRQFLHNLSAYNTVKDLPPAQALHVFLEHDRAKLIALAEKDLRQWIPPKTWDLLSRNRGVEQMVDYTMYALRAVADHLDGVDRSDEPDLKRVPRHA